jgi:hypothetical protein
MQHAAPGDIVYFRGGNYDPGPPPHYSTPALNPQNSGTALKPITFIAFPGERPFIKDYNSGPAFGSTGQSHIIWDGFYSKTACPSGHAVKFRGGDYCTLRNSVIEGCLEGQSNQGPVRVDYSAHVLIENSEFFNADDGPGSHHACGVLSYHTEYLTVRNCEFHDSHTAILDKDDGQHSRFYNNFIWNCDNGIAYGSYQKGPQPRDIWVYQNVFVNAGGPQGRRGNHIAEDCRIFNNTVYKTTSDQERGVPVGGAINTEVYNNIVYIAKHGLWYDENAVGYSDYNCFFRVQQYNLGGWSGTWYQTLQEWQKATGFDTHSITPDPLFVKPGGSRPEDYKLQPGSPALASGRNGKPMGAYITGNEIIGRIPDDTPDLEGDLNRDRSVDVTDAQLCVNVVLGNEHDPDIVKRAKRVTPPEDLCNVLDVQRIVNVILGLN